MWFSFASLKFLLLESNIFVIRIRDWFKTLHVKIVSGLCCSQQNPGCVLFSKFGVKGLG